MADGVHLHPGHCQLPQALIGGQASEGAVESSEIVEALPLMELGVEEFGVVDDLAGNEPIEFFVVDAGQLG